jgi:hypothetical protein
MMTEEGLVMDKRVRFNNKREEEKKMCNAWAALL